jgi:glycosyltransferase involved in cell wall biosynthesis
MNGPTRAPLASIITPTFDRAAFLPRLYAVFAAQLNVEIEWIVVDDSPQPSTFMQGLSDPRVRYLHLPDRTSTGEKRNIAVAAATGSVIVHFDDDDYYAPRYVRTMIDCMDHEAVDFIKLSGYFLYSRESNTFGYWDTLKREGQHFLWSPGGEVSPFHYQATRETEKMHLGYGFSYVFRRPVWEAGKYQDRYWGEDTPLLLAAVANGFKAFLLSDQTGLCVHVIHDSNGSRSFSQYILPEFVIRRMFPALDLLLS